MPEIVVKQDVTVTHKIDGEDPFAASVKAMEAMATKLENAFSKVSSMVKDDVNKEAPEKQSTSAAGGRQDNKQSLTTITPVDKLNASIENLIAALGKGVGGGGGRAALTSEEIAKNAMAREEGRYAGRLAGIIKEDAYKDKRAVDEEDKKSAATWGKVAKGMALGTATAAVYQANSLGATWGSVESIINTSGMNYNDYLISQYNKKADAISGIANTGISGLSMAAGAALMPLNPLAGAAVMGAGAIANFGVGYFNSQFKAENEFAVNQDIDSWRLQSAGISEASKYRIAGGGHFTDFQRAMAESKYATFYKDAPQVALAARRDIINEKSDAEQANFAGRTQLEALKMGVNPMELARAASNTAAISGKSTDAVLSDISANYNAYGGDPVANQNKINALVMGTSMSLENASSIVNRYQYNEAMLQNRRNDTTVSPMNRFKANLLGRIYKNMTGLDIDSEAAKQKYQNAGAEGSISPEYNIYEQAMSARGQNVWAKDVGGMVVSDTGVRAESNQPMSMSGFADDMAKALQSITLNVRVVDGQAEGGVMMSPYTKPQQNEPIRLTVPKSVAQSPSKLIDPSAATNPMVPPIERLASDRNIGK